MATKTPGSASAQTEALGQLAAFPLVEALFGRRSRRFALGGEIPDGPLAYRSRHQPMPLDELERLLVLTAMGGTTGWHYSITRHARYAPHVSNYAAAAGRTFPSAAGFHTAELFFTDDSGVWFFPTRDAGALVDPAVEQVTPELMVQRHRGRLRQLAEGRLYCRPPSPTWRATTPGASMSPARCWSSRWPTSPSTCWPSCASLPRTAMASTTTSTAARSPASSSSAGWSMSRSRSR
jgi:hypothetical protein